MSTVNIILWVLFFAMAAVFALKLVRNMRRYRQQEISRNRLMTTTAGDVIVLVLWVFIFLLRKH